MEQKVVGIDLEIEKRLREKAGPPNCPISPIREDKQLIEQLEAEIASLQEKCLSIEQQFSQERETAK